MYRWLWLSLFIIVVDQITKYLADSQLTLHAPFKIMPMLDFTLVYNAGAAFSFLSQAGGWQRWFFIALSSLISIALIIWLARLSKHEKRTAIALSLVLGGAIGNLIDRSLFGYVIDFIDVYYNNFHWPAFNIADSSISIGVLLLLLDTFTSDNHRGSPE